MTQPTMTQPTLTEFVSNLADYDPNALPVAQAQRIVQDFVQPILGIETVPIWQALDRVLAADVISPISVPAHDNSAMDGFAFQGVRLCCPTAATTLADCRHRLCRKSVLLTAPWAAASACAS
jgi:molybdopterin molybdotransferase